LQSLFNSQGAMQWNLAIWNFDPDGPSRAHLGLSPTNKGVEKSLSSIPGPRPWLVTSFVGMRGPKPHRAVGGPAPSIPPQGLKLLETVHGQGNDRLQVGLHDGFDEIAQNVVRFRPLDQLGVVINPRQLREARNLLAWTAGSCGPRARVCGILRRTGSGPNKPV
jgi:hypothetical protein